MNARAGEGHWAGSEFETIDTFAVPHGRKGKHNALVSRVLASLLVSPPDKAVKIPLLELGKQPIQNVRSALNRAGKKIGRDISTSSDDYYLYVWFNDSHTIAVR